MEAAAAKDLKDSKASSTATFNSLAKRLEEKYKQLDQLNKKYQQVGVWVQNFLLAMAWPAARDFLSKLAGPFFL